MASRELVYSAVVGTSIAVLGIALAQSGAVGWSLALVGVGIASLAGWSMFQERPALQPIPVDTQPHHG